METNKKRMNIIKLNIKNKPELNYNSLWHKILKNGYSGAKITIEKYYLKYEYGKLKNVYILEKLSN
jgi:hypothetical protein